MTCALRKTRKHVNIKHIGRKDKKAHGRFIAELKHSKEK